MASPHGPRRGRTRLRGQDDGNGSNGDACLNSCRASFCATGCAVSMSKRARRVLKSVTTATTLRMTAVTPSRRCLRQRPGDPGEQCDDGNRAMETAACSAVRPLDAATVCCTSEWSNAMTATTSRPTTASWTAPWHAAVTDTSVMASRPAMTATRKTMTGAASIQVARCGDGIRRQDLAEDAPGFEACDDGNADNGDTCLSNRLLARCGDGVVQRGVEACDDGNNLQTDACSTAARRVAAMVTSRRGKRPVMTPTKTTTTRAATAAPSPPAATASCVSTWVKTMTATAAMTGTTSTPTPAETPVAPTLWRRCPTHRPPSR